MANNEFRELVEDILTSPTFRQMKDAKHHIRENTYDHSVKVAYLCYLHHKRFGTRIDRREFVRAALLHDFYMYDWHNGEHKLHLFTHASAALKNAKELYPELTPTQCDIIERHMFPINLRPPRTQAGRIVCLYDKLVTLSDYFGKNRWKETHPDDRSFFFFKSGPHKKKKEATAMSSRLGKIPAIVRKIPKKA